VRSLRFLLPPSLGAAKATARAELIASELTRAFGAPVTTSVAASYAELEAFALGGEAEIVWCPSAVCAKLASARAVLTIVRDGRSDYRSALIARRGENVALGTLAGKRAAWVDPLSAGGYLLALALLRGRGLDVDRVFSSQAFLGSHRAVAIAVLDGNADVGAVSAHDASEAALASTLAWYVGAPAERLETIALTARCPNDAIVLTSKLSPDDAARIELELYAEGARSRLSAALEAERFERASLADYARAFGLLAAKSAAPPSR
jgi:phosphonate transport system substrate-binding protein